MKIKGDLKACPHCGSDNQFYILSTVSGKIAEHYLFNGERGDNTHMWDYVNTKPQKIAFCSECQRKIGTVE